MIQIIDNFEHRSKLPNFARDQFDTLEEMKNVRDEDIDEGHISYCISTDKHYKFNASNAIDQSTGKWREFKGEKGDPGKDGQDGTNVSSNLTAFVFKSNETTPSKPVGGSWNSDTNVFTPPTGWYTTDQNMVGTIWMSWAVFQTAGTIQGEWSTPVRITGENGKDGQDGKSIEFIYKVSNRVPNSSDKPSSVNEDGSVPDGWTDHPTGVSESNQYEWMCVRTKTDDLWSDWNGPTVWSKWGANGKDGDGVEYIYKRTTTNLSPDRPTEVSQEDDFVPEGWTDDPTGVNENNMYEWVCVRKYKEGIWSEFSNPALWAKWGEKGEPGKDGNDGTSVNIKGEVASEDQLPESAQPGDAYVVNGDLYVWDGLRWNNIGGIKGPAGDSAYVHIAFADGVVTDGSGAVTQVYGFTTTGSTVGKAYIGTYSDHTVADSQDPLVYKWQKNKGDKGDKGDQGNEGPQGVPGDPGADGITLYTWIRYAEDANGTGISNSPDGKSYIGLAYNKTTASESNNPSDYTWSKITGKDGVAGPAGEDGKTLYTWIKYADTMPSSSSSTIYDIPNQNTKYIGIAVNKDTASESTDAMVYTWSLFRGADGTNGTNGKDGRDGRIVYPAGIYDATVTYTATDTKAPYVLYGDTYYVMNVTTSWTGSQNDGKTPADDYEQYGEHATWIPMEKFEAVYAKLLIADNGTLGKFVFNGNYMFSQQGKDGSGNSSSDYENFNPDRPDSGDFQPNLYIDGLTGKIVASNAYVKGSYKEQAKLVTDSDYYLLEYGGGIVSVNRSVDDHMGKNTHQHVSIGSGWIYNADNPEKEWSSYTITNVSNTPLLITNFFSGCFRAFSYLSNLYYGVILPDKYSSVTLRRVKVPENTPVDFDGTSNAGYVDEIALIQPGQNRVTTNVTWTVGSVNYNMIQL